MLPVGLGIPMAVVVVVGVAFLVGVPGGATTDVEGSPLASLAEAAKVAAIGPAAAGGTAAAESVLADIFRRPEDWGGLKLYERKILNITYEGLLQYLKYP